MSGFLRTLGRAIAWLGARIAVVGIALEYRGLCWYCGDVAPDRWCHNCQRTQGYTRPSIWTWGRQ